MEVVLIIIYAVPLVFVFIYSLIQLNLVLLYKSRTSDKVVQFDGGFVPFITIQLPIYNEKYVIERLIDGIVKLDYPKDKFEIQVLDDSSDECFHLAEKKINEYRSKGIDIIHIQRPDRIGFKAGALDYGIKTAKGDFIAIFDADFLPESDFLKKTVPYFENENIGVVQTKWTHLNENHSLLTKLQAFGLDAHFSVEQVGRSNGDHFINFNGTAGIWRKECIQDAGGWSADTLTEDLDLSYRAQLKGWKFKYLETVHSPSELPIVMSALKGQQFRWTKGAAECARKNLFNVWRNNSFSFLTKLHSTFHLLNSSVFVGILMMSILSVPLLYVKEMHSEYDLLFKLASVFIISLFILIIFYWVSYQNNSEKTNLFTFLIRFPLFLSVSMGLSLHNGVAVIEGLLGRKTPFLRTPKFNHRSGDSTSKILSSSYVKQSFSFLTMFEFVLFLYFLFGVYMAFQYNDFGLLPFHLMLSFGYFYVFSQTVFQSIPKVSKQ